MSYKTIFVFKNILLKGTWYFSGCFIQGIFNLSRYEKEYDDYGIIMTKALADRLAEVG